ncbi:MAG: pyridoxal-phosphate dependent enzyme [Bacteroidales bacterium]|nr:pyridoxal-phosphate dependent enzyme [Bacteroidales bacterium]
MPSIPTLSDIQAAYKRIRPFVHETPVHTSQTINRITGSDIYFKCENFQKAGAFKYRGATNAIMALSAKEAGKGVATHSSGNHAAALALAAAIRGIKCYVVMPSSAPETKIKAVKNYGAEITFCEPTLESRESTLKQVVKRTGSVFIHPFDDFNVVCGQGTATLELLNHCSGTDIVMAPVGGGGLLGGTSIAAKSVRSEIIVYGAEPKNADDAYRSLKSGILQPPLKPNTIADGLLTALSELTFTIISKYTDDIFTVSEASIVEAMKLIWQLMKIIVEPSSAVPLAAIIENPEAFRGKKTGIILSGGNVDLSKLPF